MIRTFDQVSVVGLHPQEPGEEFRLIHIHRSLHVALRRPETIKIRRSARVLAGRSCDEDCSEGAGAPYAPCSREDFRAAAPAAPGRHRPPPGRA